MNKGSRIVLVRIWGEDGNAEQEIKRVMRSLVRLCPLCNHRAANRMKVYRSVLVHLRTPEEVKRALASLTTELKASLPDSGQPA